MGMNLTDFKFLIRLLTLVFSDTEIEESVSYLETIFNTVHGYLL